VEEKRTDNPLASVEFAVGVAEEGSARIAVG
jgi:hypothetical protein